MDKIQEGNSYSWQKKNITLSQFVQLRNGVPLGDPKSLQNMLHRSLGAASFAAFWRYWNPIWGYGLGKFVYRPMLQIFWPALAYIITFVVSGFIHDLVIMAIRRTFTLLFTPWFFLLGVTAVLGRVMNMDLSNRPWWIRASINLLYLVSNIAIILMIKQTGAIP
jgi:hypothetical protein